MNRPTEENDAREEYIRLATI